MPISIPSLVHDPISSSTKQWLILAICLPILWLLFRRPIRQYITPKGIPGIPALDNPKPLWGDLGLMGQVIGDMGSFSYWFDYCAERMGAISQVRVGWWLTMVVIADVPTIESILLRPIGTFDRSSDIINSFSKIIPRALLTLPTNDVYKHHRRVIGTAMSSKYLSRAAPRAWEGVKGLVELWKAKSERSDGRAWAVEMDMQGATMDAISAMAFGESLGIIDDRIRQVKNSISWPVGQLDQTIFETKDPEVAESIMFIFDTLPVMSPFPTITHFFTRLRPSYRKHANRLDGYLKTKLADSRARAKSLGADNATDLADNTLDLMVGRELKGNDFLSVGEMRDELYLYLLGGTETSATTLSWWIKYMTVFSDVQRKLRTSVLEALPELQDRPPSFDDLTAAKLPYLEAVVQETLRLSRTAGGYSREVQQDTIIMGHMIPKGTLLVMPTSSGYEDASYPMHTVGPITGEAPRLYPIPTKPTTEKDSAHPVTREENKEASGDRDKKVGQWEAGTGRMFDPDRWLKNGVFDPHAGPSLPFSLGQRGCFGKSLALMELRMFCLILNQSFFFAPVNVQQNRFQRKETVTSHPIYCFVRPVDWDSSEAVGETI